MPVIQKQDRVILQHPKGASADILFYGATVISWKSSSPLDPSPVERLFVSSKAALDGSKPVRGGIPVVFPCFGAPTHPEHAKLSQHGFARNSVWNFGATLLDSDAGVSIRLTLEPTPAIKEVYNHPFNLTFVVTLSEHQLSTDLHVKNVALSTSPLEFQALFHNYIRAPANEITITPLHNVTYYDKTEATDELRAQPKIETRTAVDVKKFTDSVYENAPGRYLITSLFGKIEVKTQNFPNVVVWNPQAEAGAKIGDMEEGGWEKYVCLEPGYVRGFVSLPAGETWIGEQVIAVIE